jgi:hypothetical protein
VVAPEVCVNVWCVVDEGTGLVYRIVARAYALAGSDTEKGNALKRLASTDFHVAAEMPDVLAPYTTTVVDNAGTERSARGLFPSNFNAVFPDVLDRICKSLEKNLPTRLINDAIRGPKAYRLAVPQEPFYVLTFLIESATGELMPYESGLRLV